MHKLKYSPNTGQHCLFADDSHRGVGIKQEITSCQAELFGKKGILTFLQLYCIQSVTFLRLMIVSDDKNCKTQGIVASNWKNLMQCKYV